MKGKTTRGSSTPDSNITIKPHLKKSRKNTILSLKSNTLCKFVRKKTAGSGLERELHPLNTIIRNKIKLKKRGKVSFIGKIIPMLLQCYFNTTHYLIYHHCINNDYISTMFNKVHEYFKDSIRQLKNLKFVDT